MDGLAQTSLGVESSPEIYSSQPKAVKLVIRPQSQPMKILKLGISPPSNVNSNSNSNFNISTSREVSQNMIRKMSPIQGPNTQEYFGHDETVDTLTDKTDGGSTLSALDTSEVSYDPYDDTTKKFCGGYGEWGHVINHTERSILPDLKIYPFPDDIKNRADVIYNKMRYQVRRGKIRSQMIFFCVYYAHVELKRDVNPIPLGSQFGLTPGEIQKCDSLFAPLQTGYKPPPTNASPLGYFSDYLAGMDLSEDLLDDITRTATDILRKDPTLNQENPKTVAAGLLRYYMVARGITSEDPVKINRVTSRSNVTIDGMFRRICTIDNA